MNSCQENIVVNDIQLTPQSRVLLEKLTVPQPAKKFQAFYGTRRLITASTSARHLSLSWARSIQSKTPKPHPRRSTLIISYVFQVVSFPRVSHKCHMPRPNEIYKLFELFIKMVLIWAKYKKTRILVLCCDQLCNTRHYQRRVGIHVLQISREKNN